MVVGQRPTRFEIWRRTSACDDSSNGRLSRPRTSRVPPISVWFIAVSIEAGVPTVSTTRSNRRPVRLVGNHFGTEACRERHAGRGSRLGQTREHRAGTSRGTSTVPAVQRRQPARMAGSVSPGGGVLIRPRPAARRTRGPPPPSPPWATRSGSGRRAVRPGLRRGSCQPTAARHMRTSSPGRHPGRR